MSVIYEKEYKENQNPKECSICHKIKPQNDFYKKGGIFASACKKCTKDKYKIKTEKNKKLKSIINKTIEDIEFCRKSINEERKFSRDSRTRKEMTMCENTLRERVKILKDVINDD